MRSELPTTRAEAKAASISKYFPGSACPKGHVAARFTSNCQCTECAAEARSEVLRRYRSTERGKEAQRAGAKTQRERHPDRAKARRKKWKASEAGSQKVIEGKHRYREKKKLEREFDHFMSMLTSEADHAAS